MPFSDAHSLPITVAGTIQCRERIAGPFAAGELLTIMNQPAGSIGRGRTHTALL